MKVYVISLSPRDDFPDDKLLGVYTSKEAAERLNPDIKFIWKNEQEFAGYIGTVEGLSTSDNTAYVREIELDAKALCPFLECGE